MLKYRDFNGVFQTLLQQPCDSSFFSILLAFSAIKGPARELRWEICEQNISTHNLFHCLRALKCQWTKCSNRVNYRLRWPLQKTFSSSTPASISISRVFDTPPLLREFPESRPSWGCGFFLEQPNPNKLSPSYILKLSLRIILSMFHFLRKTKFSSFTMIVLF